MSEKQMWWGYRHTNGSVQAKPFFDCRDLEDARESPFVMQVIRPFEVPEDVDNREYALSYVAKSTS